MAMDKSFQRCFLGEGAMGKPIVPLPVGIARTLQETMSHLGEGNLETLISAAIWSFTRQDNGVKAAILRECWYSRINAREVKRKQSLLRRVYELGKHLYAQICPRAPR
jgi:hypothetical protein